MRKNYFITIFLLCLVFLTPTFLMAEEAMEKEMEPPQVTESQMEQPQMTESQMAEKEMEQAKMTISRFVACRSVENREPAGITNTFSADTEKAYAFLEATDVGADVTVDFVWYHGDNETARVPLSIRKSSRWRTYSSKKLAGRTGNWRVEIQDGSGTILASIDFTVE